MAKFRIEKLADNVTLYCGDCREVIPTLTFKDVSVVSDPPYGIEDLVGNSYGRQDAAIGGKRHLIANDKNLDVVRDAFKLIRLKLKKSWVAAFYSCRITPTFFKMMESAGYAESNYFGEMIWDKKMPGMGGQIRYQHENVAFFRVGNPAPLMDVMSVTSFVPMHSASNGGHPHEKPHQVMVNVVSTLPDKTTVLDPFMGSGSTGAAAVQLKHGFVGIELSPKHFDTACKKIGAAIKQPVAFWE